MRSSGASNSQCCSRTSLHHCLVHVRNVHGLSSRLGTCGGCGGGIPNEHWPAEAVSLLFGVQPASEIQGLHRVMNIKAGRKNFVEEDRYPWNLLVTGHLMSPAGSPSPKNSQRKKRSRMHCACAHLVVYGGRTQSNSALTTYPNNILHAQARQSIFRIIMCTG